MESIYQALNSLGYTHPIHPTIVYLPIGCVMAAFIFGITAVIFNRETLLTSAKHCINLAIITVFPTILLGYMDWQYFQGGIWILPIKMKMFLAALLVVLLSITVVRHWKFRENRKVILGLYTLCFFNVVAIGYYGGEIVFGGLIPKSSVSAAAGEELAEPANATVTYADVEDIFKRNCILCHKGPEAPYNVQLDTYEHVMEGGLEGKVIIPGKPDESELILRLRGQRKPAMPYRREPLPEDTIETIVRWIQQGAKG